MSLLAVRRAWVDIASDERGSAALEYSIITVVVGGILIACVNTLGTSLTTSYGTIGSKLLQLASSVN